MPVKDIQLNVKVTATLRDEAKRLAAAKHISMGEFIRRLIADACQPSAATDLSSELPAERPVGDSLGFRQIPLTRGLVALVDDDDFERVNAHKWCALNIGAAQARIGDTRVQMHRFILGLTPENTEVVDHINHNKLDNRRLNLRIATTSENSFNRIPHRRKEGGTHFKGVVDSLRGKEPRMDGKWGRSRLPARRFRAGITYKGQHYNLGAFPTAEQAADAYDRKAHELFGEFALLNRPENFFSSESSQGVDNGITTGV